MTSPGSGPPVPPPPQREDKRPRKPPSLFWRVLEFLDVPILVGWFYTFLDLFSSQGTESVRQGRRRRRIKVLSGVLLLGLIAGGTAWSVWFWKPPKIDLVAIRKDAEQSQEAKDYERALALWEELDAHGGMDQHSMYQQALCLEKLERKDETRALMLQLAEKRSNFAPAHVWLAGELLEKKVPDARDAEGIKKYLQDQKELEKHLTAAVDKDPRLSDFMRKLAHIKLATGDKSKRIEALSLYGRLAEDNVDDRLDLARYYARAREQNLAAPLARSALGDFQAQLDRSPDDTKIRYKAVASALLLRDFALAERLLNDGQRRSSELDKDRLRFALGVVQSEWAEDLSRNGKNQEASAMLVESLRNAPEYLPTLERLAILATQPDWREPARAAILGVLFEGSRMQGPAHTLLARLAWFEGRRGEARLHWQLASETLTDSAEPLNALALLAMDESPPDLPVAMALVERGLAIDPKSLQLKGSRGRILAMQGQLTEALPFLLEALAAFPKDPLLHAALYDVYTRQSMHELAEKHFSQAVDSMPRLWISRARLLLRQGDKSQATKLAQDAIEAFRERLKLHPTEIQTQLLLAEAMMLARDFAGAVTLLETGLESPRKEEFGRALAQVYAEWASAEAAAPKEATADQLARLEKAVSYDPENRLATNNLAMIARSDGPQARRAAKAVDQLLSRAAPSAAAHLAAGTSAWMAGEKAEARKLFERAHQVEPTNADVANNLAWAISHSEPEDLPRALTLVDAALRRSPEHPNYRGTRGHLLARMERWGEARADLEHALKYRDDADNRRLLNEVYQKLGVRGPSAK